jgi:peptidoglycan/LPS O-acetylase OafA/YrhL
MPWARFAFAILGQRARVQHRSDIDGLRALAVLPVVLFHLDVEALSGGFVGVDIFFVISGFLITSIIANEMWQGRFSFLDFYERRVRRIFPALILVIAISSLAAWCLLLPNELAAYGQSVLATALFGSNFYFWRQSGYFDPAADTKPMLHTWSLSVEEQFYLLFPIFLIFAMRWLRTRRAVEIAVVAMALASFLLSLYGVAYKPKAAFFLAPSRAWELLMGAIVALGTIPALTSERARTAASLAGAGLIFWSLLFLTPQDPFPGLNALPACLGAALLIHAGTSGTSLVHRALSLRPVVIVGLISYSLYLWHWPLIVFAKHYAIEPLTRWDRAWLFAASLALAYVTWAVVETPFRKRRFARARGPLLSGASAAMAGLAAFGIAMHHSGGMPQRIPEDVRRIADGVHSIDPRRESCLAHELNWISPKDACTYGAAVAPKFAVWGDSHAATLMPAIAELASAQGEAVKFYGYSGCPPVLGVQRLGQPMHKCLDYNTEAMAILESDKSIETVILHARHAVYLMGWSTDIGPAERISDQVLVTDRSGAPLGAKDRFSVYEAGLEEAVARLTQSGKSVVVIYPVPETGYTVPTVLAKLSMQNEAPENFTRPFSNFEKRNGFVLQALDKLGPADRITRIYPHERLCERGACRLMANGAPLYYDDNHLSLAGVAYVSDLLQPIFAR